VAPGDCAISTITAYELFTGIEKCADPSRERVKVERMLNVVILAAFDSAAAAEAARVRGELEALGQPIGPYDTLLAGHALSLKLRLATNNIAEFGRVIGLAIENWQMQPP
jgi:tRNA(fMet)-specific endonuclease VapC